MTFYPKEKIKQELDSLFGFMNESRIDYCVLQSNVEFNEISENQIITDIDIFVSKSDMKGVSEYLNDNSWMQELSFRFSGYRRYYYKYVNGFKLKLDISFIYAVFSKNTFFEFKSKPSFVYGSDERRYLSNNVAFYFILKKLLESNEIKIEKIKTLNLLTRGGESLSSFGQMNEDNITEHKDIINSFFFKGKVAKKNYLTMVYLYFGRLFFCRSDLCVSFVGMDGAGKGTYIELFSKTLASHNINTKTVYLGHSGYKLGVMKFIVRAKSTYEKRRVLSKVFKLLYLFLLPVELCVRRGLGRTDVLITDRHPAFEYVFSEGSFLNFYNNILSFLSPKPDMVFFLGGNKDELWGRKKEMDFESYLSKSELLEGLVESNYHKLNIIKICTVKPIDDTYKEIWDEFRKFL